MRVILFWAMMVPLAACTAVNPDPLLTASLRPTAPPIASEVSPDFAVAVLPSTAGPVRTVRQTTGKESLEQTMLYESPTDISGENRLVVKLGKVSDGTGFRRAPTRGEVVAEMRAEMPGIAMTIRPEMTENSAGPYGYATGKVSSGACVYAWQLVDPRGGQGTFSSASDYRTQVRLRFCQHGLSEEQVATLMQGLQVKPLTPETLAMLRFASGSGQVRMPVAAITEPEAPKKVVKRKSHGLTQTDTTDLANVVLPITRKQPLIALPSSSVPLPIGESASKSVAVAIPLPTQVAAQ